LHINIDGWFSLARISHTLLIAVDYDTATTNCLGIGFVDITRVAYLIWLAVLAGIW
jgi:hypothetical protein